MPEEIVFEFDHFRLNPLRRTLLHNGQPRALTPNAFDLLCVLVKNHGHVVAKSDLMKAVWSASYVTDNNFNVTLAAVRRALAESGRNPTYIFKVGDGYRFVANVREIAAGRDGEIIDKPGAPPIEPTKPAEPTTSAPHYASHIVLSSCLYGLLYAITLLLEIAYQFDLYGQRALSITPFIFVCMAGCSALALAADRKLTMEGKRGGLALSFSLFLFAAAVLFAALTQFLPAVPITQLSFQSYPAQAAYLKDTSYSLLLAVCFLILPFHFVVARQRDVIEGKQNEVLALLTGDKLVALSMRAIFVRPWMLAAVLLVFAGFSLKLTSHLLDHLRPGPYMNLFTQLIYARLLVYFALGLICIIWYAKALNEIGLMAHRSGRDTRAR